MNFSKKTSQDIVLKKIKSIYLGLIRYNSQKYKEVDIKEEEIALKEINQNDVYLIKNYYKAKDCVITKDTKLKDQLKRMNILSKLRDEF
ncbi:MAG: hypothetical protein ABIM98_08835 [candidate division WOR-3 bacterium]